MAEEHLDSPQWAVKHTAARAIADATVAIATMNKDMDATNAAVLWPALERALGGKTWDGKEVVLYAFTKFVETSGIFWSTQPDIAQAIEKVRYDYRGNLPRTTHVVLLLLSILHVSYGTNSTRLNSNFPPLQSKY